MDDPKAEKANLLKEFERFMDDPKAEKAENTNCLKSLSVSGMIQKLKKLKKLII